MEPQPPKAERSSLLKTLFKERITFFTRPDIDII